MTKTSTDAQIVGSVSFINGDAQQFTDATAYLDCIREELPHEATTGFRFRTITQDPAVRKAVDDSLTHGHQKVHSLSDLLKVRRSEGVLMQMLQNTAISVLQGCGHGRLKEIS